MSKELEILKSQSSGLMKDTGKVALKGILTPIIYARVGVKALDKKVLSPVIKLGLDIIEKLEKPED